ncbi:adrenodoxin-like [Protopterus annectens]|uniref:adrenodoxin-like n=1 Tax=Protopterus annectens TaxID=7888 RepID=UPI001CFB3B39|nr:adrenodoxin-like [Protopterus annectens]
MMARCVLQLRSVLHGLAFEQTWLRPQACIRPQKIQLLSCPQFGSLHCNQRLYCSSSNNRFSDDKVTINFINRDGELITATAKEGQSLLDVVVNQHVDIEGFGACEGTLACSTCHLIFEKDIYEKLDAVTDDELDMLDLAYGLTDMSRLGCQVCVKKWMDGITVKVPLEVSDLRKTVETGKQSKQ